MKNKVFLSYAPKDAKVAKSLAQRLEKKGFQPWLDANIAVGEDWEDTIFNALKDAEFFIALVSNNYFNSDWSLVELGGAVASKDKIIPILLSGNPEKMPFRFKGYRWIDARLSNQNQIFDRLEEEMTGISTGLAA